jgi:hypothetical protein
MYFDLALHYRPSDDGMKPPLACDSRIPGSAVSALLIVACPGARCSFLVRPSRHTVSDSDSRPAFTCQRCPTELPIAGRLPSTG